MRIKTQLEQGIKYNFFDYLRVCKGSNVCGQNTVPTLHAFSLSKFAVATACKALILSGPYPTIAFSNLFHREPPVYRTG